MIRANRLLSTVLAIGLAGLTSACASGWHEAYSNKRSDVELVRLTHDVQFADGEKTLSGAERAELNMFLSNINANYGDEAWIDAGADALSGPRSTAVMNVLREHGVVPAKDNLAYGKALEANEVRLVIGRYVVTPPECPDWRKASDKDYANTASSNYGCADAVNIGMMVSNPRDLLEGRDFGGADADRANKAVTDYRKGSVQTKSASSTSSGSSGGK